MKQDNFSVSVGKLFAQSISDKDFEPWNKLSELRAPLLSNRALLLDSGETLELIRLNGEDLRCQIYIHPGEYLLTLANNHFAYQKDFPLREMIDYHIRKIKQIGIDQKLSKKYFPPLEQDCEPPIKEVKLSDTIFIFVTLVSGLIFAVLILSIEFALGYACNKTLCT